MSTEAKRDENFDNNGIDSIDGVLNTILTAFSVPEEPITPLPPPLILTGSKLRTGLSISSIASKIISRQSEAGLPVGDVFADGPNTQEQLMVIMVEEIVKAILNESVVNVVIPPGIGVTVSGVNAGGPMVSLGYTTTLAIGDGIIR
jgi:hypothetical protein